MKRTILCFVLLSALAFSAAADVPAKTTFENLKKLEGKWTNKEAGDKRIEVVYHLTGAGSALVETQFPGTTHEMVTVYHMDGDKLMLTHYCAAMNQPTMRYLSKGSTAKAFKFDFVSGTNMKPTDVHIHNVTYHLLGPDHIVSEWGMHANGKAGGVEKFDLYRVK